MILSHLEHWRPKPDKVSQKTMFIIKTLWFSIRKDEPNYYKNVYYDKWKKDLGRFYNLNIKKKTKL